MEAILLRITDECRRMWGGSAGEGLASEKEAFIRAMLADYSAALGLPAESILEALERNRAYSAANYYQEANFPKLAGVRIFANQDEMLAAFPSRRFRCPACKAISTHPYKCDSGAMMSPGKVCDWKAFGLLGTMGKGLRFTVREGFLDHPQVDEIFMPVEMEAAIEINQVDF